LENTTNTLKYSKTLYDQAIIEKKELEVKLVESLGRFDKWKESSKNLFKLINSSMSTRTKLGLAFEEYNGSNEVFDLSTPSIFDPEPENREVDKKARYSAFKISEVKTEKLKALVSIDSMLDWNEHEAEKKTKEGEEVYGLMAGFKLDFANHAGNAAGSVYDVADEFAMMGISPK
nr:hypothetical protein [Tanacetum cinerariifolium]